MNDTYEDDEDCGCSLAELMADARAQVELSIALEAARDPRREAERAYRAMYGGGPRTINGDGEVEAEGHGRWQGNSLVWNAVDWSM